MCDPFHHGRIRDGKIWIGNHEACGPEQLITDLIKFQDIILNNNLCESPLIWASRVRYELITLHPFADGNGRTSNLLCDWILASHGFLPITHSFKSDSHIGGWSSRLHFSDFEFACYKTLSAILHSYDIFFSE